MAADLREVWLANSVEHVGAGKRSTLLTYNCVLTYQPSKTTSRPSANLRSPAYTQALVRGGKRERKTKKKKKKQRAQSPEA